MKKLKVHRPNECTCPHCCQSEADFRAARLARKRRLVGPRRVLRPWSNFKRRRLEQQHPRPLAASRARRGRVRTASHVRRVVQRPRRVRPAALLQGLKAAARAGQTRTAR